MSTSKSLVCLFAVLAFLASACGDSDGDEPQVADVCREDDPACDDIGSIDGESVDGQSADDGDAVVNSGQTVDGGLSVADALATDATGTLAVQGFLFADNAGVRLCDALAESFPPQCPQANLTLTDFTLDQLDLLPGYEDINLQTEQGISWTDQRVTVFGQIDNGELVVDGLSQG
jgi:hypothetical protein